MGQEDHGTISIHALRASPLVKEFFPTGLDDGLWERHMHDPALRYQDLDALGEMAEETLRALVCPVDGEAPEDEEASAGAEPAVEEEEDELSPQSPGECIVISCDSAGLVARLKLIQPPEGVNPPGRREMLRALFQKKITSGVRTEFIARLAQRPLYGRFFRIAEGKPARPGLDGAAEFHFDPSTDLRPHTLEDGTVDYRALDFVKSVKEGDLLCVLTPPTAGTEGADIYGRPIPAPSGSPAPVQPGVNTILSADGLEIRAGCDGQVFLQGNTVTVVQSLNLEAVDFSTGNIDFPGSVHVRGDVANGFTIKAGGDIVVNGVVENATLTAAGSIALCSGIKGGGKGVLDAGQDIRTLFIESCRARAGGNIYADSVLNSFLECGRKVNVLGKRGYLLGGVCVAGEAVSAVQIGNQANTPTAVTVGHVAGLSDREEQARAAAARVQETIHRLLDIAREDAQAPDPVLPFSQELARIAILSLRLEQRLDQLLAEAGQTARPARRVVQVLESLYPNVSLDIDGVCAKTTKLRSRCTVTHRHDNLVFTMERQ